MTFKVAVEQFPLLLLSPPNHHLPHQQIRLCSLPVHVTINSLVSEDKAN